MPLDVFADPATVPTLDLIDEQVRAGLPDEAERMDEALMVEDFYRGRQEQHLDRREGESDQDFQDRPKRYSRLTRRVARVLSDQLYRPGPTRTLEGPAAVSTWLEGVYADSHVNALMQRADRSCTLSAVAAVQVEATGDPNRPIRLWLYKSHEFAVFGSDDDPACPWAVVTKAEIQAGPGRVRTKYQAWSALELRTYLTKPYEAGLTAGGRRADDIDRDAYGPSPYAGVLPFVFVRDEPAISDFWEGGIGPQLVECNRELDRQLSELADHVRWFLNPRMFVRNVALGTRLLEKVGRFLHLPPSAGAREGDNDLEPDAFALQVALGVEQTWIDLHNYADWTLEELDVPATVVRADSSTDLSGVAIVAKAIPLHDRTRARQTPFGETESELAAKVLAVGGLWYGVPALTNAALDPKLTCVWPEPAPPLPTVERDASDDWELDHGLTDPIEVLAKRRGLTLEQAEEHAREIAARKQTWDEIMGDVLQKEREQAMALMPGAAEAGAAEPEDEPEDDEDEDAA